MKTPKVIKTPFPNEVYEQYLQIYNAINKPFNEEVISKILNTATNDFLKGTISIDQLSSIGHRLFKETVSLPEANEELFSAILASAELSYYVRRPELGEQFNQFLKEVIHYMASNNKQGD